MADDLTVFWMLWMATLLVIVRTVVHSYVTDKNIYGAPFLFSLMFGYFYVFQTYVVATNLDYLLKPWMFELGQALALVCFLAFLHGWKLALKKGGNRVRIIDKEPSLNYARMWGFGIFAALVAIVSMQFVDFRDEKYDYEGTSAYVYMLYHIGYPGILACVIAIVKDKRYQSYLHKLILFALCFGLTYVFFLTARRGPTFPIIIMVVYGFGLMQATKPKKLVLVTSILVIGAAMLVFPLVRNYSEGGMHAWNEESVQALSIESVTVEKSKQDGDNEALYHMGMVATATALGNYQYGTGYLSLLTHFIPRYLWPDKPNLGQGLFPWTPSLMPQVLGWQLSSGAAAGGVAETFMELGFLAPFLWFALGFAMGRRFVDVSSILKRAQFITILAGSHWLASQGVAAAFIPMLIYFLIITMIIKLSSRPGTARLTSTATRQRA
ncbi:MAG: hypothetical protein Q7T38_00975 [Gallionella sp.]|nr:hypothetical protein [Gallionella sp.]